MYYVSTTYNCTWSGLKEDMREDYNYGQLAFFDTEEKANAEVFRRQSEQ